MRTIKLNEENFTETIRQASLVLEKGGIVVYPTDTSYALGALATNIQAIGQIYKIKQRDKNKPIHVTVDSLGSAKKIVSWPSFATIKFSKYLPGALTIILPLKSRSKALRKISANGRLGIRIPNNNFALTLARKVCAPVTATSANLSGAKDSYYLKDILKQFAGKKYQPDLVIDAGRLPKTKPSTVVSVEGDVIEILRHGPVMIS